MAIATVDIKLTDVEPVKQAFALLADAVPLFRDIHGKASRCLPADDPTLARIDAWLDQAQVLAASCGHD